MDRQTVLGPEGDATGTGQLENERLWDPELIEKLGDLLDSTDLGCDDPSRQLDALALSYDDAVYSELIYLLSHLRFDDCEARQHWREIVSLRDDMRRSLERSVDLRVALVSYFVHVNRKIKNPKIIEMELFERTQSYAYRDELTGLHNYRLFREYLSQEILRSERAGVPLSLMMIDLDSFKRYNDTNGHEAANNVLITIADLLQQSLNKGDVAVRYGGDEFALIMPMTPKLAARATAERVRKAIEQHEFSDAGHPGGAYITASIGIATFPADAAKPARLVRQADRAMYAAKAGGRNQVQLYGQSGRSFTRLRVELLGRYRALIPETRSLVVNNISEGGLGIILDHPIELASLIDVTLDMPGTDRQIVTGGRVVYVEPIADDRYQAALRITDMDAEDRDLLTAFIRGHGRPD